MSGVYARHQNWVVGILGLLLIIDLRKLPWLSGGNETISGIVLTHPSSTATSSPDGWLGLLAVVATLAAILNLVVDRLAPDTRIPSIGGSRATTRYVLAVAAAVSMAVKFVLHIDHLGDLGVGFWLGAALAAAFVYCAAQARARSLLTATREPSATRNPSATSGPS
jgi:hypothetical protein